MLLLMKMQLGDYMDINEFYDILTEYSLDSENYKKWREVHGGAFGNTFLKAFEDNPEAQIHLTAALINISQRRFEVAMPKLNLLKDFCNNEFDEAVINYFIGLNFEFLGNENQMIYYYNNLLNSDVSFLFNQSFHPYYRTAKFAQRDSECSKALHYYEKALEFYDDIEIDNEKSKILSFIYYDMGTVYLYSHNYEKAIEFLDVSCKFNSALNSQRDYVLAVLYAVQGKKDELNSLFNNMSQFLRINCESMTSAICDGTDPHYCVVPQKGINYSKFWKNILSSKEKMTQLIENNKIDEAESIVSENLTKTFKFMKKNLECRIKKTNSKITVKCKNYCVKTLIAEYENLFSSDMNNLSGWEFVSVNEFESFVF